jgi:hypothetical protein
MQQVNEIASCKKLCRIFAIAENPSIEVVKFKFSNLSFAVHYLPAVSQQLWVKKREIMDYMDIN